MMASQKRHLVTLLFRYLVFDKFVLSIRLRE